MVKTYWRCGTGAKASSAIQFPNWRTRFRGQEGQKQRGPAAGDEAAMSLRVLVGERV
jgi:hypothetical protein